MALKYLGFCRTCECDSTCTLRLSSHLKTVQSEEFSIRRADRRFPPKSGFPEFQYPAEIAQMGFCVNCLNIHTCGFPNARCGVVQCEEYILDEAGVVPAVQPDYSRSVA